MLRAQKKQPRSVIENRREPGFDVGVVSLSSLGDLLLVIQGARYPWGYWYQGWHFHQHSSTEGEDIHLLGYSELGLVFPIGPRIEEGFSERKRSIDEEVLSRFATSPYSCYRN